MCLIFMFKNIKMLSSDECPIFFESYYNDLNKTRQY